LHPLPHQYQVTATSSPEGDVVISATDLPDIASQAPAEFGGPGDRWSPESLLTAAVADCFILSFRAIAGASKVPYTTLDVNVEGLLDQVERQMKFTEMSISANLTLPAGSDAGKAERLLAMAEKTCLITNSLNVSCHLTSNVSVE